MKNFTEHIRSVKKAGSKSLPVLNKNCNKKIPFATADGIFLFMSNRN